MKVALGRQTCLADSGLFVGLFDATDAHHERCKAFLQRNTDVLLTCWAVFAEVSYLLESPALWRFFEWAEKAQAAGVLRIDNPVAEDVKQLWAAMNQYQTLPMDFCDASLVLLAKTHNLSRIATVDQRDFSVHRARGNKAFDLVLFD